MSVKTSNFITALEKLAPPEIQEEWDNSGWQIDLHREKIGRILVALEVTSDVIREAADVKADLILTHHPLFFTPVKQIDVRASDPTALYAATLIAAGVPVYSAHTSFDSADNGMNVWLARMFGLSGIAGFPNPAPGAVAIGRKGVLPVPAKLSELISKAESFFGMKGRLKVIGYPDLQISSVAVCGGGGGEFVKDAISEGIDLYITSDLKHHEGQWAREHGLALIDGGHWGTEKHFVRVVSYFLNKVFGDNLSIVESRVSADPFR
ncbi:MAG: Nif3-like dinuclear metal center hexameric protein [Clostridiales Family XIII bacterium]|jgi:dinuclear metal center YbgI/SA1388 family protein|nr:Nif3-like dinuclear metal center hexameric protein [Clostridiales Family XIII bacterium]